MDKKSVYHTYRPPNNSVFLNWEDGKTVRIRIASEPYVYSKETNWNDEPGVTTKYAWVIYNKDEERAQIMELPVTGYNEIAKYAKLKDWGDPTTYDLIAKRYKKSNGFTAYEITAVPQRASLRHDQEDKVAKLVMEDFINNAIPLSEADPGESASMPPPAGREEQGDDPGEYSDKDIPPDLQNG